MLARRGAPAYRHSSRTGPPCMQHTAMRTLFRCVCVSRRLCACAPMLAQAQCGPAGHCCVCHSSSFNERRWWNKHPHGSQTAGATGGSACIRVGLTPTPRHLPVLKRTAMADRWARQMGPRGCGVTGCGATAQGPRMRGDLFLGRARQIEPLMKPSRPTDPSRPADCLDQRGRAALPDHVPQRGRLVLIVAGRPLCRCGALCRAGPPCTPRAPKITRGHAGPVCLSVREVLQAHSLSVRPTDPILP